MRRCSKTIIPGDITIETLYVFERFKGERCELYSGIQRLENGGIDYRWMAKGNVIPFPVFSGTWFIGLPKREMLNYMHSQGYVLVTKVDLHLPTYEALTEASLF